MALHAACATNNLQDVEALLSKHSEILWVENEEGLRPSQLATETQVMARLLAAEELSVYDDFKCGRGVRARVRLMNRPELVNFVSRSGWTMLMQALYNRDTESVSVILDAGLHWKETAHDGCCMLWWRAADGSTATMVARDRGVSSSCGALLLEEGRKRLYLLSKFGQFDVLLAKLNEDPELIQYVSPESGWTVMHQAFFHQCTPAVLRQLLDYECFFGRSMLAKLGEPFVASEFVQQEMAVRRAIHTAAHSGRWDVVKQHLTARPVLVWSMSPDYDSGWTLMHHAQREGDADAKVRAVAMLRERGARETDDSEASLTLSGTRTVGVVRIACRWGFHCRHQSRPSHTNDFSHPCPKGLHCVNNHSEHRAEFRHPCVAWDSCESMADAAHCNEWEHPCPYGVDCTESGDALHQAIYVHACPNEADGSFCSHMADGAHAERFQHVCRLPASECNMNDARHWRSMMHPIPPRAGLANAQKWQFNPVDKRKLQNPTQSWMNAPYIEVKLVATGTTGQLLGWEIDSAKRAHITGKLVVSFGREKRVCKPTELVPCEPTAPLRGPWDHEQTHAWRCAEITQRFDALFARPIAGAKCTFAALFATLHSKGVPVFVIGGAVRDLCQGMPLSAINDIDCSFGCSAEECCQILKGNGQLQKPAISVRVASGLVQVGDAAQALAWEGKSIGGWNADRHPFSAGPASISTDLHLEALYRDYTVNSLCYDPINGVVLDPTGRGLPDTLNGTLHICAPLSKQHLWCKGNPSKLVRYFHMLNKGYTPSYVTRQFVHAQLQEMRDVICADNSCIYVASGVPVDVIQKELDTAKFDWVKGLPWKKK